MKKILLTTIFLALFNNAYAAPQENSYYIGGNLGYGHAHDDLNHLAKNGKKNNQASTFGIFGGYQITKNIAVESGYDYDGVYKAKNEANQKFKHKVNSLHLDIKASYPITEKLDLYGKAGAKLTHSNYFLTNDKIIKSKKISYSPVFTAGLEYAITPQLSTRIEYEWINNVGSAYRSFGNIPFEYQPDISKINLGISYHFGNTPQTKIIEEKIIEKTYTLSSDVLFDFDKDMLKQEGKTSLDKMLLDIEKNNVKVDLYKLNGYTDRLGSEKYNIELAKKRVETVSEYLIHKGVDDNIINLYANGKINPVTGETCQKVKNRTQLIQCLSPDRRVEIDLKGTQKTLKNSN